MRTRYTKRIEKIMTSGMTTGQILRALTELRIERAKEKKLEEKKRLEALKKAAIEYIFCK